jgi:GNAT superfamily N-acetyltransferase
MPEVQIALTAAEIESCFHLMLQLHPALSRETFVARVQLQQQEGYRLAYLKHNAAIVSVAGFRIQNVLWSGRTLYVDDLITDESHRGQGHGTAMLTWLIAQAREANCDTFSLDSATHRRESHAFYFRHGLRITDYHFQLPLK